MSEPITHADNYIIKEQVTLNPPHAYLMFCSLI